MNYRQWINQHQIVVVAALIIAAIPVGLYVRSQFVTHRPFIPTQQFFVDQANPSDISLEPVDAIPPIEKDGKTYVRGVFYTTTGNDSDKQLAYLEKYTEAGKAAIEKQRQAEASGTPVDGPPGGALNPNDCLVRTPDNPRWVPMDSPDGVGIVSKVNELSSGNKNFRIVFPR